MPARIGSTIPDPSFAAVLHDYRKSPNYLRLKESTRQRNYDPILAWAHDTLGAERADEIDPYLVQCALDGLADRPGLQANARSVIQAVQKWAIVRRRLPRNITEGTEIVGSDGGHEPWSDAEVALARQHARPDLARAILLMAHTGQRGSDIIKMRWTDLEENEDLTTGALVLGINVRTLKTGRRLWVPCSPELATEMEAWRTENKARAVPSVFIVTKPNGEPYQRTQLSWWWNHERDNNSALVTLREAGRVLHGLRATCVVNLRKRRLTDLLIGNMIGMSEPMVARYSRLADQRDMALTAHAAVHHVEFGRKSLEKVEKAS